MSATEAAIAHLMQIRDRLAPIRTRLANIEAGMAAVNEVSIEGPVKISLRVFTSRLLSPEVANPAEVLQIDRKTASN